MLFNNKYEMIKTRTRCVAISGGGKICYQLLATTVRSEMNLQVRIVLLKKQLFVERWFQLVVVCLTVRAWYNGSIHNCVSRSRDCVLDVYWLHSFFQC